MNKIVQRSFYLLFLLFTISAVAQVKFERISVDQGLSQAAVHNFCQDNKEYLWIATRDGLNRYDGLKFSIFRHDNKDSTSIANNKVWNVIADSIRGGVWAGTSSGISYFNTLTDSFDNYYYDVSDQFPKTMDLQLSGDSLWIATMKGLYLLNIQTREWKKINGLENREVYFVHLLSKNKILIGEENGLLLITGDSITLLYSEWLPQARALLEHKNGYYLVSNDSIYRLNQDLSVVKSKILPKTILGKEIISMAVDDQQLLWVGDEGIYLYSEDLELQDIITNNKKDPYSIASNNMTDIIITNDQSIWVGNNGYGINKFNKHQAAITTLKHNPFDDNSISDPYIQALYASEGRLYVNSRGFLDEFDINAYPPVKLSSMKISNLELGDIKKIIKIEDDNFILVSNILPVNYRSGEFYGDSSLNLQDAVKLDSINLLLASRNGLIIFNLETEELKKIEVKGLNGFLSCLYKESNTIWVGLENGISRYSFQYEADASVVLALEDSYDVRQLKSFYRDHQKTLWVGTWGMGMYKYIEEENKFIPFEKNNELPNQTIYGILEDRDNNLWFSTNQGIVCFKRVTDELIQFTSKHGLQSNEFNTNSYGQAADGRMFFGGIDGLSYFYPKDLLEMPVSSSLFLSNVWVDNIKLQKHEWENNRLILSPNQTDVRMDFTSVSFGAGGNINYRYKLNNADEYISLGQNNNIYFSNLSPGDYSVYLNATDPLGRWMRKDTVFNLTIQAPFWKKASYQFLFVVILIGLGILINHLRVLSYKRKNIELERLVKERTYTIIEQNNEIITQNEELQSQGDYLSEQNALLERKQKELLELKNTLEDKVKKRTKALKLSNDELIYQNQQMEQYSYITSHNLRGPVASLKGLMNILPKMSNETDDEIIVRVKQSVFRLDSIIKDLGTILELQEKHVVYENILLSSVISHVVKDLDHEIGFNDIDVHIEKQSDIVIFGLRAYLESIFYNLIHNAIKFRSMNIARSSIKISFKRSKHKVEIKVTDNGIGIDLKYSRNKLFRLFQRVNDTYEGRGVGLYMSKIQVELMDGSIYLESEENVGTVVTVTFPMVPN